MPAPAPQHRTRCDHILAAGQILQWLPCVRLCVPALPLHLELRDAALGDALGDDILRLVFPAAGSNSDCIVRFCGPFPCATLGFGIAVAVFLGPMICADWVCARPCDELFGSSGPRSQTFRFLPRGRLYLLTVTPHLMTAR